MKHKHLKRSFNVAYCKLAIDQGLTAWPTDEKRSDGESTGVLENRRKRPFCRSVYDNVSSPYQLYFSFLMGSNWPSIASVFFWVSVRWVNLKSLKDLIPIT